MTVGWSKESPALWVSLKILFFSFFLKNIFFSRGIKFTHVACLSLRQLNNNGNDRQENQNFLLFHDLTLSYPIEHR
jgi:hypothetical protein